MSKSRVLFLCTLVVLSTLVVAAVPSPQGETLPSWLKWIVGGGGGVIAWALIGILKRIPGFLRVWDGLPKEVNTLIAYVIAAGLGAVAFFAQVRLGYVPTPETTAGWFEVVFSIVISQIVYNGVKLLTRSPSRR